MRIGFKNQRFILQYDEQDGAGKVLLDIGRRMDNKSRYPLQLTEDRMSIPNLLLDLMEGYQEISGGDEEGQFPMYLLDILFTSYIMRTSAPLKVLEIGAVDGIMSYHLATLLGKLNRESKLCCVSNVIGNESGSEWLDRIAMVGQPPDLSMVAADYTDTNLASDTFDIVVINGTVWMEKPYEIVREAERMVKRDGILMCHAKNLPLLESSLKLVYSDCQEYELSPVEHIYIVERPGTGWDAEKEPLLAAEAEALYGEVRQAVRGEFGIEEARPLIFRMDELAERAIREHDADKKVQLLELKEKVLDFALNRSGEFAEYYRERLYKLCGML